MKIFDVVNEKDEIISSATAKECHSNPELIHRVTHFTLIDTANETILIGKRPISNAFDAGKWCFFGEHVLSGDDYTDAFENGLNDELGLQHVNGGTCGPPHIFSYVSQREIARFMIGYFHKKWEMKIDSSEVEEIKWVSLDELKKMSVELSDITKFWMNNTDWEKAFNMAKKGW